MSKKKSAQKKNISVKNKKNGNNISKNTKTKKSSKTNNNVNKTNNDLKSTKLKHNSNNTKTKKSNKRNSKKNITKENKIKQNKILIILTTISIICLLLVIISATYSLIITRKESEQKELYKTGNISVDFSEETSSIIKLTNALPTKDEYALDLEPYTFTITGNSDNNYRSEYTVKLNVDTSTTTMPLDVIKVKVNDEEPVLLSSLLDDSKTPVISTGVLDYQETKEFNIRIWIDINATVEQAENKTFSANLEVEGKAVR